MFITIILRVKIISGKYYYKSFFFLLLLIFIGVGNIDNRSIIIIMNSVQTTETYKPVIMKSFGLRKKRQGIGNHELDDYDYNSNSPYPYQYPPNVPVPKNSRDIYTNTHRQQYIPNDNSHSSSSSDLKNFEYETLDYGYLEPPPYRTNETIIQAINNNNSTEIGHQLHIKGAEVVIVLLVLLLWVGAIALFFHRWGKIRMLEPYQPKFCESHRLSCPMGERSHSKLDLSPHFAKCNYHGIGNSGTGGGGIGGLGLGTSGLATSILGYSMPGSSTSSNNRLRQNSVFVTSIHSTGIAINGTILKNPSRKTKSAFDLSTLVLSEEFQENVRRNSKNSITQL